MSDVSLFNNSVAWAHYRLKGGRRNAFMVGLAYFLIVGGLMLGSLRLNPREMQSILYGWMGGLLALQSGVLLLYGSSVVRNAVRRDMTSGMIHSHRLMPISGTEAVAGYVLGSAAQPLVLAAATLLLGVLAAGPARLNVVDWMMGNGLLLLFAVCTWIAVVCMSFLSPKSAGGMFILLLLLAVPGGTVLLAVPAATLVVSPLVGWTVFGMVMKGTGWNPLYHTSIFSQLVVTILFFIVAARKFRRDDVLSAGPLFGLLIVGVFVAISALGVTNWARLQPMLIGFSGNVVRLQLICSMMAALLLAFVPLSAAAWLQASYQRRRRLNDPALGRRPLNVIVVVMAAALIITLLPAFCLPRGELQWKPLICTFLCLASSLLPIGHLMRWRYHTRHTAAIFVGMWMALAWIVPWMVSFAMLAASGLDEATRVPAAWERSEVITCFSPVGALISIWASTESQFMIGLGFQVLLAAGGAVLFRARRAATDEMIVPVPSAA